MDETLAGDRDGIDAALEPFREDEIRCRFAMARHDAPTLCGRALWLDCGWPWSASSSPHLGAQEEGS